VRSLPANRNVPWDTVPTGSTAGASSTGIAPELDPDGSDEVVSADPPAASASLLHAETETTRLDTTSAIKLTRDHDIRTAASSLHHVRRR
jgi:hypothetical protein